MNGGDLATALEGRKQTAAGLPERAIWNLLMQLCEVRLDFYAGSRSTP